MQFSYRKFLAKLKKFPKEIFWFLGLAVMTVLLFHQGFFLFFYQDDFIHVSFSQNISQVLKAFNIFSKAEFPFYRPIPTQVYFYLGLKLFGFNSFPFHLVNFFLLLLNSYLIFRLGISLNFRQSSSFLASIFYALNSTHVAPMFSAAYVHELLLTTFSLLTIYYFRKLFSEKITFVGLAKTLIFWVFSLMTKETAIIVPGLAILALLLSQKKFSLRKLSLVLLPFVFILLIYGLGHFFFYGIPKGGSYVMEFGKATLNIFGWYLLWAMSVPAILVDYIGPKLAINPFLWQAGGINIPIFLIFFPIFLFSLFFCILKFKPKFKLLILALWLVVGLLPMLPFPKHHLAIEQTLSLIGLSFLVGEVFVQAWNNGSLLRFFSIVGFLSYLMVAFNSVNLAQRTHYTATGSRLVWRVITHLKNIPGGITENTVLYFKDGQILVPQWGSSRQISLAFGEDKGIKLLLKQPNIQVYFEDGKPLPKNLQGEKNVLEIDSSEFLYK